MDNLCFLRNDPDTDGIFPEAEAFRNAGPAIAANATTELFFKKSRRAFISLIV